MRSVQRRGGGERRHGGGERLTRRPQTACPRPRSWSAGRASSPGPPARMRGTGAQSCCTTRALRPRTARGPPSVHTCSNGDSSPRGKNSSTPLGPRRTRLHARRGGTNERWWWWNSEPATPGNQSCPNPINCAPPHPPPGKELKAGDDAALHVRALGHAWLTCQPQQHALRHAGRSVGHGQRGAACARFGLHHLGARVLRRRGRGLAASPIALWNAAQNTERACCAATHLDPHGHGLELLGREGHLGGGLQWGRGCGKSVGCAPPL